MACAFPPSILSLWNSLAMVTGGTVDRAIALEVPIFASCWLIIRCMAAISRAARFGRLSSLAKAAVTNIRHRQLGAGNVCNAASTSANAATLTHARKGAICAAEAQKWRGG